MDRGQVLKTWTYSKICQETPTHTHTVLKYSGRQVISIELITYLLSAQFIYA